MSYRIPQVFDGLLWDGSIIKMPGLRIASPATIPHLALSRYDSRPRSNREKPLLGVAHNTIGEWPLEVRSGLGDEADDIDVRNALSWRNDNARRKPRNAGTQLIVSPSGRVLCLADCKRMVGYGAGHARANGYGINLEMAAHRSANGGTVIYQAQVEAAARVFNELAVLAGWQKVAQAPRPRGRELVKALADPRGSLSCVADHCAFTRSRSLGDSGYLVGAALHKLFGWQLVDFDAAAVASTYPELPTWLRGADVVELHGETQQDGGQREIAELVEASLGMGLSIDQAVEVGAHAAIESGWGLRDVGFNWWGWKHRQVYAEASRALGVKVLFWRRPGHPGAGDPDVCYYRGFHDQRESLHSFLAHFCPRPGTSEVGSSQGRYAVAGQAFWSDCPEHWFGELIAAGYRGQRTADQPEESVREHGRLTQEVGDAWAQFRLGVAVDGVWGPRSRAALKTQTGDSEPTPAALRELAAR